MRRVAEALGITDEASIETLCAMASTQRLARGQKFISEGEMPRSISFPVTGVLRTYFTDATGHEVTDCIVDDISVPLIASADTHAPSFETIEALTDCELVSVRIDDLERAVAARPPLAAAYIKVLERAWYSQWSLRTMLRSMSARERYLWFLETYPGVIGLLTHRNIASFINVTPVTLSRVRSALRHEGIDPDTGLPAADGEQEPAGN